MSDELATAESDPPVPSGTASVMRASEVIARVEQAFDVAAAAPETEDTWMRFGPEDFDARAAVADYLRSAIDALNELVDWLVPVQASVARPRSAG